MLDLFSQACKPANVNSTVRVRSNARLPLMSRLREKKSLPGGFLRSVFPSFLRCSPAAASLRCPSKRKVRHFHGTLLSLSRRTSFVRVLLYVLQNVFYVEKKAYIESLGFWNGGYRAGYSCKMFGNVCLCSRVCICINGNTKYVRTILNNCVSL